MPPLRSHKPPKTRSTSSWYVFSELKLYFSYSPCLNALNQTHVLAGHVFPIQRLPGHGSTDPEFMNSAAGNKRNRCLRATTSYETTTNHVLSTTTRTCSGNRHSQACFHYQSVIREHPDYGRLTCPYSKAFPAPRPAVALWDDQHNGNWITGWMQQPGLFCQRDEYPPADIWQDRGGQQWIRFIPRADNVGAGAALFGGLCSDPARSHLVNERSIRDWQQGNRKTELWSRTVAVTRSVLVLNFANMQPWADDGIPNNPCYPSTLVDDPGFALLWDDQWYDRPLPRNFFPTTSYAQPPGPRVTRGKQRKSGYFEKRIVESNQLHPDEIFFDDGNFTRQATDQELFEKFHLIRCKHEDCASERKVLGIESAAVVATPRDVPTSVKATTTLTTAQATVQSVLQAAMVLTAEWPKSTI